MRDTLMRVRELRGDPGSPEEDILPGWLIAAGSGAGAALASATMLVVLAVLGWLTGAGGSESAGATVSAGLAGWAFAHGAPLGLDKGSVGLIPWLLAAWPLLCAWWSAQRVVPAREATSPRLRGFGGMRRDVPLAGGSFVAGYTLTAVILGVAAHFGGARPSIGATAFGAFVLATLAYVLALRPGYRGRLADLAPRLDWARREYLPAWVGRAVGPALTAAGLTIGAGALLVIAAVVLQFPQVAEVYGRIGGGVVGATLLTIAQLAYLPSLAVWAASWLAGPGFMIGSGTSITWLHSEPGVIPLVPVLATLPPPGPLPAWAPAAVVVPLLIGVTLGVWCVRRAERSWIGALRLTGVAVVLYALVMLVAAVASSGSVGADRFAHVGVDAVVTTLALTAEVGLPALLAAALTGLRWRTPRPSAARAGTGAHAAHTDPAAGHDSGLVSEPVSEPEDGPRRGDASGPRDRSERPE